MTPLPLEKQVCSLEPAKKLRDLGVPQESCFYWYGGRVLLNPELSNSKWAAKNPDKVISAFTVSELLHRLPTQVNVRGRDYYLRMMLDEPHCYFARYIPTFEDRPHLCDFNSDDGMADPLAECYAYLIEQGI